MSRYHVLLSLFLITLSLSTFPSISGVCTSPPLPLEDGVSTLTDAPDTGFLGSAYYFSFLPSPPSGPAPTQLTIALTMITGGYAEIYVLPSDSSDPQCPAKNTRDVVIPADGIYRTTVFGTLRKYWITVYVKNAGKFSVTATYASATTLIDGVPQAGRASATSTPVEWFKVRFPSIKKVPNTNTDNKIRFSLVPVRGNAFFYVSSTANQPSGNTPNTISSTASLAAQNEVIWDFSDSRYARPTDGWFYIGVQGVTYCQFVFTAHQYYTNAYLTPGLPQRSSLNAREWHYYVTRIENPSCKLTVVVTPFSGDPDLYSSATYLQPNLTSYDRRSLQQFLNDSVVYTTTVQDNEYGIGVYGYSTTSYSIVSVVDCVGDNTTDIAYLVMGQPQEGTLLTGQSMWYRVSVVDSHHDIQFSITIENNGDPDIYISNTGVPRFNASDWNSRSTFTWSGENVGNDIVLIPHDIDDHENPLYCPTQNQDYCDYYIQVYAYGGCSYTLTVTQSQAITQLRNGISMHEDLAAGEYEYFTMYLDQPNQALTVSVTDLGRGDPDLFINVLTNFTSALEPSMFPNLSNPNSYKWQGRAWGPDTVIVPPSASATPQLFLIAVHAWTSTSFSIVATFNRSISLSPGTPQAGNISSSRWVYYEYISNPTDPNDEAVSFVLQTSVGSADMYVSRANYPSFTNYEMLRRFNQVPQKLDVNHTLASTCEKPCRWFIGIWGRAQSTAYTLTVHAGTNVQLINGQPASDTLFHNQYAYYEIFVPRNQNPNQTLDLNVIVTTLSGDPDMYMTNATDGTRPTNRFGTYQWYSNRFGGDSIDIERVRPGTYTLGILCLGNCSYTVLSLLSSETPDDLSIVTLYDGQPQRAFLPRNHWRYFSMDHTMDEQATTQVTYTLTSDYGDPDLYIKYSDGKLPTRTSYDASALAAGTAVDVIRLDHPVPSVHLIGVYSYHTTMFTLLGSSVRDDLPIPTQPTDGETITVNNTTPLWQFFEMENVEGKSLTVKVIAKSRDTPIILGSVDTMYPRENDFIWKGSRLPVLQRTYVMTIDTTDPRFTTGFYYIGIKGAWYDVTFSFGETRGLQDGIALTDSVNGGASQFFTFRVSNTTNQNVVVRASPCSGSIALYMDQNEKQPGPRTAATWTDVRQTSPEKEIVISNGKFASTNFYVGVYGATPSSFEIRADNDNVDDIIPVVTSVPGTSDLVTVTGSTSTSVTLSFYPAVSRLGADSLQYEIRYTQDSTTVMDTSCGATQATFARKVDIPTGNINQTTSVTVDGLQPSSLYRFTIVVNDYTIGAPQRAVYKATSPIYTPAESAVITEDSSSGSLKLLLGLGIPAFILLAAGLVYLYIRNRRLTKELEVEMHDVPKGVLRRAVGRGVALEETDEEKAARTSRPFSNLLTDGDHSDAATTSEDPDAYNPPDYARQL